MKFRATREEIYAQVLKDTEEVLSAYPLPNTTVKLAPSLKELFAALKTVLKMGERELIEDEALADLICNTNDRKGWTAVVGHLFERLLSYSFFQDYAHFRSDRGGSTLSSYLLRGELAFLLEVGSYPDRKVVFELKGKPTRVISKLFGEKVATELCTILPMKERGIELHFAKHYIPELYQLLAKDEGCTSCMSHSARHYGLPEHLHPTLAYEGSPDSALALLWDESKKRYIGRAIVSLGLHEEGEMAFSRTYGACGSRHMFSQFGLEDRDCLEGLRVRAIEWEGDYLLPYVDGDTQRADLDGEYFVVTEGGEYEACHSTGRARGATFYCDCCGDGCEGDQHSTENGTVCDSCMEDYREVDGDYVHLVNLVYMESEGRYAREDDVQHCDFDETYYPMSTTMYELTTENSWVYIVAEPNLSEAIEQLGAVKIDGEPIEQEEEAA